MEAKKIADWSAKMAKIEEASRKKDELNNEFMIHTKEALLTKMEHSEEKREAIITDLKEKLKVIKKSKGIVLFFLILIIKSPITLLFVPLRFKL